MEGRNRDVTLKTGAKLMGNSTLTMCFKLRCSVDPTQTSKRDTGLSEPAFLPGLIQCSKNERGCTRSSGEEVYTGDRVCVMNNDIIIFENSHGSGESRLYVGVYCLYKITTNYYKYNLCLYKITTNSCSVTKPWDICILWAVTV